jgi:hypothetical protein
VALAFAANHSFSQACCGNNNGTGCGGHGELH